MLLAAETIALCLVFWGACWLGTGTDEKNIKSYGSYPDTIQEILKRDPVLAPKIRESSPVAAFLSNVLVFSVLLFLLGLPIRSEDFGGNFLNVLIIGQVLNAFDFLVMDLLWWRHTPRIRFTGTKNRPELYSSPKKHFMAFLRGIPCFLIVALVDGLILSLF